MSIAGEYLDLFQMKCTTYRKDNTLCQELAVAVYASDDYEPKAQYVCQSHAEEAELYGDGPVFWQKLRQRLPETEIEEFRLTLAEEKEKE